MKKEKKKERDLFRIERKLSANNSGNVPRTVFNEHKLSLKDPILVNEKKEH